MKEIASKENLFTVLDVLDKSGITYWLDGGWGVDVLIGKQTREHRDIDINFDAAKTELFLNILKEIGYQITTDCRPTRIELYHPKLSYIDIHPFMLGENNTAKQADLKGGWYEFEADVFGSAVFEERKIPCISLLGQLLFHSGYELREIDKQDIKNLQKLLKTKE